MDIEERSYQKVERVFEYFYLFPVAIVIAILANSSGFSGGVLFQPVFYFFLQIPLSTSIATGIATETLGMTSGALRYFKMKMIDFKYYRGLILWILSGNILGLFIFKNLSIDTLRLILGLILVLIAILQITLFIRKKNHLNVGEWRKRSTLVAVFSGMSSALTGTGQAELMQPLLVLIKKIDLRKANATAIALEASGNLFISAFNLQSGNINYSILMWTGAGVIIGGQIGAIKSIQIPSRLLKLLFSSLVFVIGLFYLYRSLYRFI
ncbi:sulfite exporter TauE/SafE family protein [bacterium]|nr:sulfite exporter TauE/SafE family protein [bacterium]